MCCLEARIKCQLARLLISPVPRQFWPPCLWKAATDCIRLEEQPVPVPGGGHWGSGTSRAPWPAPKERAIVIPIPQMRKAGRTHTGRPTAQVTGWGKQGQEPLFFRMCSRNGGLEYRLPVPGSSWSHPRSRISTPPGRVSALSPLLRPGGCSSSCPIPTSQPGACLAKEPPKKAECTPPGALGSRCKGREQVCVWVHRVTGSSLEKHASLPLTPPPRGKPLYSLKENFKTCPNPETHCPPLLLAPALSIPYCTGAGVHSEESCWAPGALPHPLGPVPEAPSPRHCLSQWAGLPLAIFPASHHPQHPFPEGGPSVHQILHQQSQERALRTPTLDGRG